MIHPNDNKKKNGNSSNNHPLIAQRTIFTLAIIIIIMAASSMVSAATTAAATTTATTTTTTTQPPPPPVTAATDNGSVNVVINWDPVEIEPNQDIEFTFDFQDPSSGESISHVNYNFEIIDENGETVQSMTELHTHSGSEVQTMTFDTTGRFNLVVTIIGTGIDPPFDTTQSGTAQTAIMVGQQLPAGADAAAAAADDDGGNNTTATSGIELSPQPIWEERVATTGVIPINETHSIVEFVGNGTMTVPDTGETINMTNNGTAVISPVAGSADTIGAYGREFVFLEDNGDTTAITFYEIVQYQPEPFQGKGLVIAVFDRNATGSLAPFNGMLVAGTHEEQPNAEGTTITLWEWEGGIGNNTAGIAPPPLQGESPVNTTTTTS